MSNEEQVINAIEEKAADTATEETSLKLEIRGTEYPISYTMETVDKFTRHYVVKVEGELYKALEMSAYFKTKGKYMIPGFRKGKATMQSIKNHYGEGAFMDATIDEAIDSIYKVMYRPVFLKDGMACMPSVDIKSFNLGSFEFYYIITDYAKVENLTYKDLEFTVVSDGKYIDEIAERKLKSALDKAGYWEDVTDRALDNGDTATIDYAGRVGEEYFEGGTAQDQELEIGSGHFIPGFESQLVGMNIGETKDITVTFPEEYGAENLAGKEAIFTVSLKAIKVKKVPQLDDEFAKDVSEFDTLDELKASYRAEAEKESAERAKKETEGNLIEAVLKANESYELPKKAIDEAAQKRLDEFEDYLKNARLSLDNYLKYINRTREQVLDDYAKEFEASEKRNLILSDVITAEGIKLEENEADAAIAENAEKAGKSVEDYKKEMKGDELDYIFNQILSNKLIARLKELNKPVSENQ